MRKIKRGRKVINGNLHCLDWSEEKEGLSEIPPNLRDKKGQIPKEQCLDKGKKRESGEK